MTNFSPFALLLLIKVGFPVLVSTAVEASQQCITETVAVYQPDGNDVDFCFLVDLSPSMSPIIEGVKSGLSKFVSTLVSKGVKSRFSIIAFGGRPSIRLPFTSDTNDFFSAMDGLSEGTGSQEASMEAIRGALRNGEGFRHSCPSKYSTSCVVEWNPGAKRVMILVTDEDSDAPTLDLYKVGVAPEEDRKLCYGYFDIEQNSLLPSCYEPHFVPGDFVKLPDSDNVYTYVRTAKHLGLSRAFEDEMIYTADQIIGHSVFMNALVSKRIGTDNSPLYPISSFDASSFYWRSLFEGVVDAPSDNSTVVFYQYGNPFLAEQNSDFTGFDAKQTLENLDANGFGNSVQARVLRAGSLMRVFEVGAFDGINSNQQVIDAFFSQVADVQYVPKTTCSETPDTPVGSTSSSTTIVSSAPASDTPATSSGTSSSSTTASSSPYQNDGTSSLGSEGEGGEGSGSNTNGDSDSPVSGEEAPNDTSEESDNGGDNLPPIIASAAVGAGLIAAGLAYWFRPIPTPTAQIATSGHPNGSVSENPLYQNQGPHSNPLYEGPSSQ